MRTVAMLVLFTSAIAAGSCASSLGSGPDAGPGGGGGAGGAAGAAGYDAYPNGTFCDKPLGDDCSPAPLLTSVANICTLNGGIGFACLPCGSRDAGQFCGLQPALIRGTQYSYIQIFNVDVAWIYVYDQSEKLVAKLEWSANGAAGGQPWTCSAGPAVFDSSEAMSLLPAAPTSSELSCST